ncbi:hypothetical protein HDU76_001204 [Blyttiomyces sp. JEL0837]|nr:hypothetical protein HDU76_001204 [Blyttiomyces sp. JEL0837]
MTSMTTALSGAFLGWLIHILQLIVLVFLWPFLFIYPIILFLLTIPEPQRMLLFLHKVNFPFFVDWDKPEMFGFTVNKVRNLKITTPDGVTLGAWHILPSAYFRHLTERLEKENAANSKNGGESVPGYQLVDTNVQIQALKDRPVFLYFHGNAGNRAGGKRVETYRNLTDKLNVNVFTIDYRGFGNSDGSPSEEGLAIDARTAWDWLIKQGVKEDQITILGHSLGTGVASRLAKDLAQDGIHPRGLVLQAPYASVPDVAFDFNVFQLVPLLKPAQFVPGLHSYLRTHIVDKFDTMTNIHHIACPTLIVHGARDREIPSWQSRMVFHNALVAQSTIITESKSDGVKVLTNPERDQLALRVRPPATTAQGIVDWMDEHLDVSSPVQKSARSEGRRWVSYHKRLGEGKRYGPSKIMFVELHHAHHNNIQSYGE